MMTQRSWFSGNSCVIIVIKTTVGYSALCGKPKGILPLSRQWCRKDDNSTSVLKRNKVWLFLEHEGSICVLCEHRHEILSLVNGD